MDDLKISNSLPVVKKAFTCENLLNVQNYLNFQTIDGDGKSIAEMEEWLSAMHDQEVNLKSRCTAFCSWEACCDGSVFFEHRSDAS